MNQNKNTDKNEDVNNQVEDENTTSVNIDDTQSNESTSIDEKDSSKNVENFFAKKNYVFLVYFWFILFSLSFNYFVIIF